MRRATSIRTKLVLLLATPLIALVVLAGLGVRWTSDAASRSGATVRGTEAALVSTRAALEVARERGLAAAVVTNPGAREYTQELRFQRGQADVALDHLARVAAGAGADAIDGGVVDEVVAALAEARARTDGGLATIDASLTDYSAVVDTLLSTGGAGVAAIEDADLRATASSYTALTRLTDAIALQQSLLVTAYSAGHLDEGVRDRAVVAVALEDTWRTQFEQGASPEALAEYDEGRRSPSVAATDRLRSQVLALGPDAPVPDDGDLWFTSTTRKVDLLAALADAVGSDMSSTAEARGASAERTRVLLLLLGAAALALIAILATLLHRLVVRPIRDLTAAAHAVARDVLPRAVAVAHSSGPDAADDVAVPLQAPSRDELGDLTDAFNAVQRTAVGLAAEQATLRRNVSEVFVNLGRRTQNLITRQLDQIDHLEERTDDPDTLSDLFLLDHLATRLRRNAENMLVLAGAESPRPWARPVSIVNVVRAALAESADYSRVELVRVEPAAVVGAAVSDISHLLAELVDNALAFSPPTERVVVTGRHIGGGRYGVVVEDAGLGMAPDRLAQANARIEAPPVDDFAVSRFLGLYVVGRLAGRHGAEVRLADSRFGGVAAHVLLPARVIVTAGDRPRGSGGGVAAGGPGPAPGTPPAPSPAYNPPLTTGAGDG
jgi:signal transduction histidine kinase